MTLGIAKKASLRNLKTELSLAQKSFSKRKKTMSLHEREYKHGESANGRMKKRM